MLSGVGTPAAGRTPETGTAVPARLHTAAVQFESLLLKELLAPLTQSSEDGNDDAGGSGGAGPLQGFAAEAVAGSMAQSGALGFAREIERTLQQHVQKTSRAG